MKHCRMCKQEATQAESASRIVIISIFEKSGYSVNETLDIVVCPDCRKNFSQGIRNRLKVADQGMEWLDDTDFDVYLDEDEDEE